MNEIFASTTLCNSIICYPALKLRAPGVDWGIDLNERRWSLYFPLLSPQGFVSILYYIAFLDIL